MVGRREFWSQAYAAFSTQLLRGFDRSCRTFGKLEGGCNDSTKSRVRLRKAAGKFKNGAV